MVLLRSQDHPYAKEAFDDCLDCLDDYRPGVLTPVIVRCGSEACPQAHALQTLLFPSLDPMQITWKVLWKAEPAGPEYLPLELDPGIPD